MKQFDITGMSCAACRARVEKAVNKLENVEISDNVRIINSGIKDNTVIEECCQINKARVAENVQIGKFSKLIGELKPAVVLSGSVLDANVEVLGATVYENSTITVNKTIVEDVDGGQV